MLEAELKTRQLQLESENAELKARQAKLEKRQDATEDLVSYLIEAIKDLKVGQLAPGKGGVKAALTEAVVDDVLNPQPYQCGNPKCNGRGLDTTIGAVILPCREKHLEYDEKLKRAERLNREINESADRRVKAQARKEMKAKGLP